MSNGGWVSHPNSSKPVPAQVNDVVAPYSSNHISPAQLTDVLSASQSVAKAKCLLKPVPAG